MSIRDIVTTETEDRLIFLGRVHSDACWEIGQLTNEIIADNEQLDEPYPLMAVYKYVADLTGKGESTIRRYKSVDTFYSDKVLQEEYDVLSFDHFANAMTHGQDGWRRFLDVAIRGMDQNGGRPPSVEWVNRFLQPVTLQRAEDDIMSDEANAWQDYVESVEIAASEAGDAVESEPEEHEPSLSSKATGQVLATARLAVAGLAEVAYRLPLTRSVRERLESAVDDLLAAIFDAEREVTERKY